MPTLMPRWLRPRWLPAPGPRPDVLIVGDSLTAGHHATQPERAFPALVGEWLRGRQAGVRIRQVGLPGGSVEDLLRLGLRPPAGIAIVEVGTNDWLGFHAAGPWTPTPLSDFAADYRRLLRVAAGEPGMVRMVCLGLWASPGALNRWGVPAAEYDSIIAAQCDARQGHFVRLGDLHDAPGSRGPGGRPAVSGPSDDEHPNDSGHQQIAALLQRAL